MSCDRVALVIQSRYSASTLRMARRCSGSSLLRSRFKVINGQFERSLSLNAFSTTDRICSKKYSFRTRSEPAAGTLCESTEFDRRVRGSVYQASSTTRRMVTVVRVEQCASTRSECSGRLRLRRRADANQHEPEYERAADAFHCSEDELQRELHDSGIAGKVGDLT